MKVADLLDLLRAAESSASVVVPEHERRPADVTGARLKGDGSIAICSWDGCPPGLKASCPVCLEGCLRFFLVHKDGGLYWIEGDELRGPDERENRYEIVKYGWFDASHPAPAANDLMPASALRLVNHGKLERGHELQADAA